MKFSSRRCRLIVSAVMPLALAGGMLGLAQSTASAAGKGAITTTFHAHGTEALGFTVITFFPPGPALPAGCWMEMTDVFVSTVGNGMGHFTANKTGDWFTSNYTGTAIILPVKITPTTGTPVRVVTPNTPTTTRIVPTTSATPLGSGHLKVWFGTEDNNKSAVHHATITFKGALATGTPATLSGHFDVTTNANGKVTATPLSLSCS